MEDTRKIPDEKLVKLVKIMEKYNTYWDTVSDFETYGELLSQIKRVNARPSRSGVYMSFPDLLFIGNICDCGCDCE